MTDDALRDKADWEEITPEMRIPRYTSTLGGETFATSLLDVAFMTAFIAKRHALDQTTSPAEQTARAIALIEAVGKGEALGVHPKIVSMSRRQATTLAIEAIDVGLHAQRDASDPVPNAPGSTESN